jgi:ClpX C4-type zinc finger
MRCPLCAQPLDGGDLVMVCRPCHQSLGASLEVSTTGEFRVAPSQVMSPEQGTGDRVSSADVCAWCHKPEREVRKLLGRGSAALCEECISLACDILDAELGEWR